MVLFLPILGAFLGAGSMIAGGIMGNNAAQAEAAAQRAAAEAQAKQVEKRAAARAHMAHRVTQVGERQVLQARYAGRINVAAGRAAMSGSGVQVDSGSAAMMATRLQQAAIADTAVIRFNAYQESKVLKQEAKELWQQASDVRETGKASAAATQIGGTSSIVSGVSQATSLLGSVAARYW